MSGICGMKNMKLSRYLEDIDRIVIVLWIRNLNMENVLKFLFYEFINVI